MPKASELKKGVVVEINGMPHIVKNIDVKSPSSRGANTLYKIRFNNLQTGQKLDESFKGDDILKDADCQRMSVQFSYMDGEDYVFMNMEDYTQYPVNKETIEDELAFLAEGQEDIVALIMEGNLIGIELPTTVILEVVETAPGIKGASASARTKPATLNSGATIQVPEYLEQGEKVKVNTQTAKFISRA